MDYDQATPSYVMPTCGHYGATVPKLDASYIPRARAATMNETCLTEVDKHKKYLFCSISMFYTASVNLT